MPLIKHPESNIMAKLSNRSSFSNGHTPTTDTLSTTGVSVEAAGTDVESRVPSNERFRTHLDDRSLHPDGYRSLSFISIQAFILGNVLSACIFSVVWLAKNGNSIWRVPAFFTFLSLFHFLEFYMTARFNAPAAKASSFLLFNNGRAYTLAHTMAAVEIISANFLFPSYQTFLYTRINLFLGLGLIVTGQIFRSIAMAHAGTNFNHIIARERKDDHILITEGVYSIVRHPSYFGFFWWAIGTQVLVGNKISLFAYAVVLWRFFNSRIQGEEKFLIKFFEDEYVEFRKRTPTGIPFIP